MLNILRTSAITFYCRSGKNFHVLRNASRTKKFLKRDGIVQSVLGNMIPHSQHLLGHHLTLSEPYATSSSEKSVSQFKFTREPSEPLSSKSLLRLYSISHAVFQHPSSSLSKRMQQPDQSSALTLTALPSRVFEVLFH